MAAQKDRLSECLIKTNCVLVEWEFNDVNLAYQKLIKIASDLPRIQVIENEGNYWHAIVRSLIFRFQDDLEILRLPNKRMIQVKSSSRIGVSDLGVNRIRVGNLYSQLVEAMKKEKDF